MATGILDYFMITAKWDSQLHICITDAETWGYAVFFIFDTLFSLICLYLFVKPLYTIKKEMQDNNTTATTTTNNDTSNSRLRFLIQKYNNLTGMVLISTVIAIMGAWQLDRTNLIDAIIFITIVELDCAINIFCIFLFNTAYDSLYQKLCICFRCTYTDSPRIKHKFKVNICCDKLQTQSTDETKTKNPKTAIKKKEQEKQQVQSLQLKPISVPTVSPPTSTLASAPANLQVSHVKIDNTCKFKNDVAVDADMDLDLDFDIDVDDIKAEDTAPPRKCRTI